MEKSVHTLSDFASLEKVYCQENTTSIESLLLINIFAQKLIKRSKQFFHHYIDGKKCTYT